jgi:hypothetical protein
VARICAASAAKTTPIYATDGGTEAQSGEYRLQISTPARPPGREVRRQYEAFLPACEYFVVDHTALPSEESNRRRDAVMDPETSQCQTSMGTTSGTRPFLGQKGYARRGLLEMDVGDVVVIFSGASIRMQSGRSGRGGGHFGEANCDRVMDGESTGEAPNETFVLV